MRYFFAPPPRNFQSTLGIFFLFLLWNSYAAAQSVQHTANKPDLALKSDAHIDPATLGMNLSIPLGGAAGRGGVSLPVSLRYSSKVWRIAYLRSYNGRLVPTTWTKPRYGENSTAGWNFSLARPWIEFTGQNQLFDIDGKGLTLDSDDPSFNDEGYYIKRINVHLPDGSSHELRADDTPRLVYRSDPNYDFTGVFYATDGSRARFESATNTLWLADGSHYVFTPGSVPQSNESQNHSVLVGQSYTDRNGNTLTYQASGDTWTDTLGRSYANNFPVQPADNQETVLSVPGYGGTPLNYKARWQTLGEVLQTGAQLMPRGGHLCTLPQPQAVSGPVLFHSESNYDLACAPHTNGAPTLFNPIVLAELELPNGRKYEFTYNAYGEIVAVRFPTGGYEKYEYGTVAPLGDFAPLYTQANRGVIKRWVSPNGLATEEASHFWQYSVTKTGVNYHNLAQTVAPDGTRTERLLYGSQYETEFNFDTALAGRAYEQRVYNSANQLTRRNLTQWAVTTNAHGAQRNPQPTKEVSIVWETGGTAALTTATTMSYDADLNPIATSQYGYAAPNASTAQTADINALSLGTLLRTEETTFLVNDPNIAQLEREAYRARNLLGLPTSSRVKDGAGNIIAQSRTSYDEPGYRFNDYPTVPQWDSPATEVRGNPTTSALWRNTDEAWLETHVKYDQTGNPRQSWDALGRMSVMEYSPAYGYAHPTLITTPIPDPAGVYGSTSPFSVAVTHDFSTGAVLSITDSNGNTSSFEYDDSLGRQTKIVAPDGGEIKYIYSDAPNSLYIETLTKQDATITLKERQYFDGIGREVRTFNYEGRIAATPWLATDTYHDALNRVEKVSTSYRVNANSLNSDLPTSCQSCTTTQYDSLSRVITVTTADGAVVSTNYNGNTVTVTDQAGKQTRTITDALGRLAQTTEASHDTNFNYNTDYTYDALGNLRKVTQGEQTRFFMYDSLSRLIYVSYPEQTANSNFAATDPITLNNTWSLKYEYDAVGNLQRRVDARGVQTDYFYDALNRNTRVTYSEGTPEVKRYYDGFRDGYDYALPNAKSEVWQTEAVGTAVTTIDSFDAMGRPLTLKRQFQANGAWSTPYTMQRGYDMLGNVIQQMYPSGHTTNANFDNMGRLKTFAGNLGDGVSRTYTDLSAAESYNERGLLQQERLGTLTPLYRKLRYNVREQLWDLRLSSVGWPSGSPTDTDAGDRGAIVNCYTQNCSAEVGQGNGSGMENNGNVLRQDIKLPNGPFFQQNFTYDSLNRLLTVSEKLNGNGTPTIQQTFGYDRYGNRTISNDATKTWNAPAPQFGVQTSTNRLTASGGCIMNYDAAGNLINDTCSGSGARAFDGENRMKQAQGNLAQASTYSYDGDGLRFKRGIANTEVWQFYGFEGELIAEYAAQGTAIIPQKEYGYRNGQLLMVTLNGDEKRLRRFVENFYRRTWKYVPNNATVQAQVNALATQGLLGESAMLTQARSFGASLFTSATYTNSNTTNGMYVADLYLAYLQRPPDEGGFNYWKFQLDNGYITRTALREAFSGVCIPPQPPDCASEFKTLVNALRSVGVSDYDRLDRFVNYVYTAASVNGQTPPSEAQVNAEHNRFDAAEDKNLEQVRAVAKQMGRDLLGQYANNYRQEWSDAEYVTRLYAAFLRQPPDKGFNERVTQVTNYGRHTVLEAFLSTGAYQEQTDALYREIYWLVADHLGTPRMITGRTGSLAGIKRHDYLPFGEEIYAGMGGRTSEQGYVPDSVRQKLAGSYERDQETGLDYARARYYASSQGRFIMVDPLVASGQEEDPQTWNRYAYVSNNPLRLVDPDGLMSYPSEYHFLKPKYPGTNPPRPTINPNNWPHSASQDDFGGKKPKTKPAQAPKIKKPAKAPAPEKAPGQPRAGNSGLSKGSTKKGQDKGQNPEEQQSSGDVVGGAANAAQDAKRLKQLQAKLTKAQRAVLSKLENEVTGLYVTANARGRELRNSGKDDRQPYTDADTKKTILMSNAMVELEQKGIKSYEDRLLLTRTAARQGETTAERSKVPD